MMQYTTLTEVLKFSSTKHDTVLVVGVVLCKVTDYCVDFTILNPEI